MKIQTMGNLHWCLYILFYFIFKEKDQNLNFWWYFKVPQANCFWADFGRFGQFRAHLGNFG
jgi:hypothetical protein